jgi:hypothetical protein
LTELDRSTTCSPRTKAANGNSQQARYGKEPDPQSPVQRDSEKNGEVEQQGAQIAERTPDLGADLNRSEAETIFETAMVFAKNLQIGLPAPHCALSASAKTYKPGRGVNAYFSRVPNTCLERPGF